MSEKAQQYIESHKARFLEELLAFLRIPSISSQSKYKEDMHTAARWLRDNMKASGIQRADILKTEGHPVVYGEHLIDIHAPTVLVYGHYDVQPPEPLELWDSDPFDPVIKDVQGYPDGAIFARGACDDKGQLFMHVKAFEAMKATDTLTCNVKFLIEGEEEVGSEHLEDFLREHLDLLKCDVVLISDTAMVANDIPAISVGLRGLSYMEVEVTGPKRDLHSGVYGGAVANPANILCEMIASLIDDQGRITISGFYDDVKDLSEEERKSLNSIPHDDEEYKKDLDVGDLRGEEGYTTIERASIRPTLDVNGIWSGYTGEGAKTVLPSRANAKISMRLVPDQNTDRISNLFTHHIESLAPDSVKVEVSTHHGGNPKVISTDSDEYRAAAKAIRDSFGKDPVPLRGGGSIPIVSLFSDILKVDTILLGFGLDSDNLHSPNEKFGIFNYYKGIETLPYFYQHYKKLKS